MKIVLDANNIFQREIPTEAKDEIYLTTGVYKEIKDKNALDYLNSHLFHIIIRDPKDEYIAQVSKAVKSSLLYLSEVDIGVVALSLELSEELADEWISPENLKADRIVKCESKDNGILNALNKLGLLNDLKYIEKKFKLRCYGCYEMYDSHVDFCKNCGYNTITRVTVIDTEEGEKVLLKKDYKPKNKVLKGPDGIEIISADQKEYLKLLKQREKLIKSQNKTNFYEE